MILIIMLHVQPCVVKNVYKICEIWLVGDPQNIIEKSWHLWNLHTFNPKSVIHVNKYDNCIVKNLTDDIIKSPIIALYHLYQEKILCLFVIATQVSICYMYNYVAATKGKRKGIISSKTFRSRDETYTVIIY